MVRKVKWQSGSRGVSHLDPTSTYPSPRFLLLHRESCLSRRDESAPILSAHEEAGGCLNDSHAGEVGLDFRIEVERAESSDKFQSKYCTLQRDFPHLEKTLLQGFFCPGILPLCDSFIDTIPLIYIHGFIRTLEPLAFSRTKPRAFSCMGMRRNGSLAVSLRV
jgi:hypothetical protein